MILDEILEAAQARADRIAAEAEIWEAAAAAAPPARDFTAGLAARGLQVIAEIKRASPSAGPLAPGVDPAALAAAYATGGAAAISVLTEPRFFSGSLGDLQAVRAAVDVPLLRKDFLLHPAQVAEARAAGADAVLLIVAALDDAALSRMLAAARRHRVAALVEVHTEAEADRARATGATIIGVNNRDLTDFTIDLGTAERLSGLLDGCDVTVAESGVSTPEAAGRMAAAGFDAILVGEALVTAEDPAALLRKMRSAGP